MQVQVWGDLLGAEAQRHLQHRRDAGGALGVPRVGLQGPEGEGRQAVRAIDRQEGPDLHGISEARACAVRLYIRDGVAVDLRDREREGGGRDAGGGRGGAMKAEYAGWHFQVSALVHHLRRECCACAEVGGRQGVF